MYTYRNGRGDGVNHGFGNGNYYGHIYGYTDDYGTGFIHGDGIFHLRFNSYPYTLLTKGP